MLLPPKQRAPQYKAPSGPLGLAPKYKAWGLYIWRGVMPGPFKFQYCEFLVECPPHTWSKEIFFLSLDKGEGEMPVFFFFFFGQWCVFRVPNVFIFITSRQSAPAKLASIRRGGGNFHRGSERDPTKPFVGGCARTNILHIWGPKYILF
jgi:hypothetical protein